MAWLKWIYFAYSLVSRGTVVGVRLATVLGSIMPMAQGSKA